MRTRLSVQVVRRSSTQCFAIAFPLVVTAAHEQPAAPPSITTVPRPPRQNEVVMKRRRGPRGEKMADIPPKTLMKHYETLIRGAICMLINS